MTSRSHGFLEFLGSSSNFLIDRELLLFLLANPQKKAFKCTLKAFLTLLLSFRDSGYHSHSAPNQS